MCCEIYIQILVTIAIAIVLLAVVYTTHALLSYRRGRSRWFYASWYAGFRENYIQLEKKEFEYRLTVGFLYWRCTLIYIK